MRGSVRGAVRSSERFRFARTFWTQVSPCTKDPRIRNASSGTRSEFLILGPPGLCDGVGAKYKEM